MADAKEFRMDLKYKKGDEIYHPVFKETGRILQIEQAAEGTQKILVQFEKSGEKKLLCGIKIADE